MREQLKEKERDRERSNRGGADRSRIDVVSLNEEFITR